MKSTRAAVCAALPCAFSMALLAHAQSPQSQQPQPTRETTSQSTTATPQQVTMTGCVQRESDYRRAQDAGRGGVAGTGVGAGNEFVLINASSGRSTSSAPAQVPTGTAGVTAAYELTGAHEAQAAKFVGMRVEISGMLKPADADSAGRPTGGPTAGKPPEGVDVAGKDLKLRELEVTTIKETSGNCPVV